jgi:pentatricopeptide repeat protein
VTRGVDLSVDSAAFAAVLRAAVAAHQPHRALQLHDEMISNGFTLTVHTLEPLAAACRDACDLPRASALLATCGEQGVRPSDRAVADIVRCCIAVGDWDAAEGVWATVEKLGVDTPARFPLAYTTKVGGPCLPATTSAWVGD